MRELDPLGLGDLDRVTEALSDWQSTAFQYVIKAFTADDHKQVLDLSDSKVDLERRLRMLQENVARYKADADQLLEAHEYIEKLEHALKSKNEESGAVAAYVRQVEKALAERDEQLRAANLRVTELEGSPGEAV